MTERDTAPRSEGPEDVQDAWKRVREAFDQALDLAPEERPAFLASRYAPDIVAQASTLLGHHEEATQFLTPPGGAPLVDARPHLAPSQPDLDEVSGQVLAGRYTIGALIGHGGSASVFEAMDAVSRENVAIKIRRAPARGGFDLIHSEATALRLLRLPGVVELRDEGSEGGLSFLVMERIHGRPFPGRAGPLPWEALRLPTLALLETLARVHWTGIAHCDLKPSNVLLQEDGMPIVLDLGVAQDPDASEAVRRALALARTPRYTSPEQLVGEPGSARSDLFSVGVMLYEALTGRDPHDARDTPELLSFRPHVQPRPLASVTTAVPTHVAVVIDQLIATSPSDRPPSAGDALARLNHGAAPARAFLPRPLLTESALAATFLGHERIHHIPSDAARELHARTAGHPDAVEEELAAWERAGLVRREGGRYLIRRANLERLRRGLRVRSGAPDPNTIDPADQADLLVCVDLLGPHASLTRCAEVLESAMGPLEVLVDTLVEAERLQRVRRDGLRCTTPSLGSALWGPARRKQVHARIATALPSNEPLRLYHRLMAGDHARVGDESLPISEALLAEGKAVEACSAISEGIRALRRTRAPEDTHLAVLLRASLQVGTSAALHRLSYTLGRAPEAGSPMIERLTSAAQAAHLAMQGDCHGALEALPALSEGVLDDLSHSILSIRLFVARQLPPDETQVLIDEAAALSTERPDQGNSRHVLSARAWLAYARDEYTQAARLHEEAARLANGPLPTLSALLNCASAWLEASAYEPALDIASRVLAEAHKGRNAHHEARAERIVRAVLYRSGQGTEPDTELTAAITGLGVPQLETLICINEAAVAWRCGQQRLSVKLAEQAAALARKSNHRSSLLLACAQVAAAGGTNTPELLAQLCEEAEACSDPAIAVQSAYLLSLVPSASQEKLRAIASARAQEVPRETWETRLEVTSIAEAVR